MHRVWLILLTVYLTLTMICSALLYSVSPVHVTNVAATHKVAAHAAPFDIPYRNFELQLDSLKQKHSLVYEKTLVERAKKLAIEKAIARTLALTPKRLEAYWWATTQHDRPYVWGGLGPFGYDCSGLVVAAYEHEGIYLPRTTFDMLASSELIQIPESEAQLGDLAFYGSGHVEFFVNNGETYGAANPVDGIGWHMISSWWAPTMFFRVAGAG